MRGADATAHAIRVYVHTCACSCTDTAEERVAAGSVGGRGRALHVARKLVPNYSDFLINVSVDDDGACRVRLSSPSFFLYRARVYTRYTYSRSGQGEGALLAIPDCTIRKSARSDIRYRENHSLIIPSPAARRIRETRLCALQNIFSRACNRDESDPVYCYIARDDANESSK